MTIHVPAVPVRLRMVTAAAVLYLVMAGCGHQDGDGPRVVTAQDIASGRVLAAEGFGDLGFVNLTAEDLLLDQGQLQYRAEDGRWVPCITDSPWGADATVLPAGAAQSMWGPDSLFIDCEPHWALRYGTALITDGSGNSPALGVPSGRPVRGPARVAAVVESPGWCVAELSAGTRRVRRVFTEGRPVVELADGQQLRSVGCDFRPEGDVPATTRSTISPGVWTVGTDIEPGPYRAEDGMCLMTVQRDDVFAVPDWIPGGEARLTVGQVVSTDCDWAHAG
jgi:hypothetical protein